MSSGVVTPMPYLWFPGCLPKSDQPCAGASCAPSPRILRSARVVRMPMRSRYALTWLAVTRSRTMLVAVLSLSTIMRWTTSPSGSLTPADSSDPITPDPVNWSAFRTASGFVHLILPRATASNTAAMMGSLMVLAARTGSAWRIPTAAPVSRFLA